MSIYGPRLGRGIYGTGYAEQAAAPMLARTGSIYDSPFRPLPQQQSPQQEPQEYEQQPVMEDDPSIIGSIADAGLGGLSMVGNMLDLPASMIRDVLTWLPGGIKARNPFDQLLSPLSYKNRTTGEELLRLDQTKPESTLGHIGKFVAGLGAEFLLDPLTYTGVGLIGKGVGGLGKSGQIVRRAGMLDDVSKVAAKKAGAEAGTIGAIRGKQIVTPLDMAKNLDDAAKAGTEDLIDRVANAVDTPRIDTPLGSQQIVDAYQGMFAKEIAAGKMPKAVFPKDSLEAFGRKEIGTEELLRASGIPEEILTSPLGGNLRWKIPFREEKIINDFRVPGGSIMARGLDFAGNLVGDLKVPKSGKTLSELTPGVVKAIPRKLESGVLPGDFIATAADTASKTVRESPLMMGVSSMFDALGRQTKNPVVREGVRAASKLREEFKAIAREQVSPIIRTIDDTGVLKGNVDDVLENSFSMMDYIERVTPDLAIRASNPDATRVVAQSLDQSKDLTRMQSELAEQFGQNQEDLGKTFEYVRKARDEAGQFIKDKNGDDVMETFEVPALFDYMHRARQDESGPLWRLLTGGARSMVGDGAARERWVGRHMPTSAIQRMSIDTDFAGTFDKGVMKRKGDLRQANSLEPQDTGVLGSSRRPEWDSPEVKADFKRFQEKYKPYFDDSRVRTLNKINEVELAAGRPPLNALEPEAVKALDKMDFELYKWIKTLNRRQAEAKIPAYMIDPVQATLSRLEGGYSTLAHNVGVQKIIGANAKVIKDRPIGDPVTAQPTSELAKAAGHHTDRMNLFENAEEIGFNYDRGKDALVKQLGEPAEKVRSEIVEHRRQGIVEEMVDELLKFTKSGDLATSRSRERLIKSMMDNLSDTSKAGQAQRAATLKSIADKNPDKLSFFEQNFKRFDDVKATSDEILQRFEIDSKIGTDLAAMNKRIQAPEEVAKITELFDTFTNLFKTHVTATHPAFHIRNLSSASVQNVFNDFYDPTQAGFIAKYTKPYKDYFTLRKGKTLGDANQIPEFAREGLTNEQASERIVNEVFAYGLVDSPGAHNDLIGGTGGSVINNMIDRRNFRERVKAPDGTTWFQSLNPLESIGVLGGRQGKSRNALERFGRAGGDEIEMGVRVAPFIALRRQGFTAEEAARRVKEAQVDYSNLTDVERKKIRRLVPFYGFTKGMSSFLGRELVNRPGGKVAMTIKAGENASGNDPGTPEHVREGLNIPFGMNERGDRHYLTNLDLMHEAPLNLLGSSLQDTMFNFASLLHPIAKWPIEYGTNQSLFMPGPGGGGRRLDDLDPLLGRTLSNVGTTLGVTDRESPVRVPGGKLTESVVANSPFSRYLHQVRKATDSRKSVGMRLLDGLTGVRFTTVDAKTRDAVLREQLENLMRSMGGRTFSQAYMPDTTSASMSPEELQKVNDIKEALRIINARRRAAED